MNRALFTTHCYLSWGFVSPYIMALVHVLTTLRAPYSKIVKEASDSSWGQFLTPSPLIPKLYCCQNVSSSHFWHLVTCYFRFIPSGPLVHMHSHRACFNVEFDKGGNSTMQYVVSWRTKSISWFIQLGACECHLQHTKKFLCDNIFSNLIFVGLQFQVFIAVLVDNFLYPISAFRSHFSQSINWSGIRYYLRDGKISKVHATHSVSFSFLSFTFAVFWENSPCQMILDVSVSLYISF